MYNHRLSEVVKRFFLFSRDERPNSFVLALACTSKCAGKAQKANSRDEKNSCLEIHNNAQQPISTRAVRDINYYLRYPKLKFVLTFYYIYFF